MAPSRINVEMVSERQSEAVTKLSNDAVCHFSLAFFSRKKQLLISNLHRVY
jgi:hypothetical protein